MEIGSRYLGNGRCEFRVWAPFRKEVAVVCVFPEKRIFPMERDARGYWKTVAAGVFPGAYYLYRLDGAIERPDPASRFQPEGVHGPSQVIDRSAFAWHDESWPGVSLEQLVLYELHVGTFTPQGDFAGVAVRLKELVELGVTGLNIMPVAQFHGERNWGYDVVYPFAVQHSYGGPNGLRRLVDNCHRQGIAVILDVVYNHLGPEGNYFSDFAPYFTAKYRTPWGDAINFDDAHSDEVRNFFIENALHWFADYHIDGLRLDAIHAIYDHSAKPFLQELAEKVHEFGRARGRKFLLIAESDLNDVRVILPRDQGGYGLDGQWCDDFHHALHTLLTREKTGYYLDFGNVLQFDKACREGFVYSWQYSRYRKRHHGSSSRDRPGSQLVVFAQNHDQVGNRMLGERLASLVTFEALKLAAAAVLLAPYVPLLFMGEEYGEETPFLYFVQHSDLSIIEAVREGRKREFSEFRWRGEPPDPQSLKTFSRSVIHWRSRTSGRHKILLEWHRRLLELRRTHPVLARLDREQLETQTDDTGLVLVRRWHESHQLFSIMNFAGSRIVTQVPVPGGKWRKLLDSAQKRWDGPGSELPQTLPDGREITVGPLGFALYECQGFQTERGYAG